MRIQTQLKHYQNRVTKALDQLLPSIRKNPTYLHKAMRYASLNGGKRIRAALVYATGEALGADLKVLDRVSAAVEMIHAFSLIHDDLPALDNDALRRGKPSCHIAFGEATAIMAGDALHAFAFEILSTLDKKLLPHITIEMIKILSHSSVELARGEILDILMENKKISLKELNKAYKLKTGEILSTSILLGALAGNCQNKKILKNLQKFGDCIGLSFQIHDDIIGIQSDTKTLGKPKGSDHLRNKPTYPSILGIKKAKKKEDEIFKKGINFLKKSGIPMEKLKSIADFIIERNY